MEETIETLILFVFLAILQGLYMDSSNALRSRNLQCLHRYHSIYEGSGRAIRDANRGFIHARSHQGKLLKHVIIVIRFIS